MSADCLWDEGVTWFSRRTVAPTELPMTTGYVTSQVLRVANGTAEDGFVRACIGAATDACEKDTGRALAPQTWELILSRFPYGSRPIVIPRLPLITIDSVSYVDEDGVDQTLAGSPAEYVVIPSGEFQRAQITPLYDATWPATRYQPQAVTITFTCGYESNEYPETLLAGIGLLVGEMYKTRTLSADGQDRSQLQLSRFWRKVEG
jgi:uncharacterized phiE125 gp8 family phage protein